MNHTNTMNANQENMKKKNMSIKLVGGGGGGGLAGIILLGGALALVTTFAFKRKRQSKSEKNEQEDSLDKSKVEEDHALLVGEGLSFLVPHYVSPLLNDHGSRFETCIYNVELSLFACPLFKLYIKIGICHVLIVMISNGTVDTQDEVSPQILLVILILLYHAGKLNYLMSNISY